MTADAAADIGLINVYSVKVLKPEDVFCFSVILCDNEVDRDTERFTNDSLDKLAKLYIGKTGVLNHNWSAEKQVARLYRCQTEELSEKNSLGEMKRILKGSAYMLRTEATTPMIEAIEGGIVKEVSVGCSMGACNCSICGKALILDWRTWTYQCETGHIKGQEYDGRLCVGDLADPREAYEFSFVAVPSQRGAGVTKGVENIIDAIRLIITADLGTVKAEDLKTIIQRSQLALCGDEERRERAKILAENLKYMKGQI
jgi:hypothetical protein